MPLGCNSVPFRFEGQWYGFPLVTCYRAISSLYYFDLAMTMFLYPLLIKSSFVRIHRVLRPPLRRVMISGTPWLYILGGLLVLGRRLGPESTHFQTMSWMQHAPQ